ncbi:uncharacterized protein MELLADRAFT_116779 [Melampsora larici-populina 98AG31]|uniref:Uncharacterized protein n=1 Tax=Melampsora larici-populina (strain 98AG31 / pathotype 3-4-7) TaxID=747676 RepID=F4RPX6_MELLP|nr:uncharacterized protein MELLADRAFT_116779 [Melampsora larici-populina 98AG31]EGG05660.1 hypothetical protein MELLADRAFT_116779 [Melampsora larici-populina 98AG31]
MALTSQYSSLRSSTSSSHLVYFEILILILPFPLDFLLHLYLNLIGSLIDEFTLKFHQLSNRVEIIYSISCHQFLNFLFYLIQLKFIFGEPFPISSTTKPFDSYHLLSSSNQQQQPSSPHSKLSSYSNSRASILITNNCDHHPLALNLALEFAKVGYHVFLQVSSHSQLSEVILRWQRLKSQINKSHQSQLPLNQLFSIHQPDSHQPHSQKSTITGSLIPLVYTTHHLDQRNDAISTIRAYAREESFDMMSLIHVIHPQFIRQSHLNPPLTPTPSLSPSLSPSRSTRRLSVTSHDPIGLSSPTHHVMNLNHHSSSSSLNISSPTTTFYPNHQIPISSCSESYLFDTFNDLLLGPLSHTQDFLPTLISLKGRVLHIWASEQKRDGGKVDEDDSINLMGLGRDGVKRMVKMLGSELKAFGIPVSLIFTKTNKCKKIKVSNHQLTNDVRSILTEESDPLILRTFQNQVEIKQEEERKFKQKEVEEEEDEDEKPRSLIEICSKCS